MSDLNCVRAMSLQKRIIDQKTSMINTEKERVLTLVHPLQSQSSAVKKYSEFRIGMGEDRT